MIGHQDPADLRSSPLPPKAPARHPATGERTPKPPEARPRQDSSRTDIPLPPGLTLPVGSSSDQQREGVCRTYQSACGLLWQALADGLPPGRSVKPRPFLALKDSSHLTTHEQQLQAYRAYEQLLQDLPAPLSDPQHLLQVANQLLYLPDTFPAAYLQIYDPIIPACLKIPRALELLDLSTLYSPGLRGAPTLSDKPNPSSDMGF